MAIYRVGPAGATVFDAEGREIGHLSPGQIVIGGTIEAAEPSTARDYEQLERRRRYADKMRQHGRDIDDKDRS